MPAVSVIIPTYNCAEYIGEALESVFAQTFTDYELIVINDGSPDVDELERVLLPFQDRIVYIRLQQNRGLAAARNAGVRAARAPLVALLDADDAWESSYLAVQVETLERDPTIDVIYPNAVIVGDGPDAGLEYMELSPSEGAVTFEGLVSLRCTVMVSAVIRRETLIRAGMFDESLRACEDFDLWLRIANQGGRIAYHRRVLVRYRRRPGSLSSDPARTHAAILHVLDKVDRTMALTPSESSSVARTRARIIASTRLHEAKRALRAGDAQTAIKALREANAVLRSGKIALALVLLHAAPPLLVYASRLREQLAMKR